MTAVLDHPNAAFWMKQLDSGVLYEQAEAARAVADEFSSSDTDVTVTVYDSLWRPIGVAGDYIEVSGTIPRNQAPQATLKLKENHWLDPFLAKCETTMVGVVIETEGIREAFYVKRHREKLDESGQVTLTSELVGIWDILNYLVIWPSWQLPIAAQPFSHAIYAAPLCTAIETMAAQQSFRIQAGLNEFLNNALSLNPDVRAWIGTLLEDLKDGNAGNNLKTPLYVKRTGLLRDGSPLFVRTVRMETVGQVITDITKAYGVDVRVYLWMPGDKQPDAFANLTKPTYVMEVKDRSQIKGPTGTVLDSALRTVVDVQGSILGNTLAPILNPLNKYAPDGTYIAPTVGIDFIPPWAVLVTPDTINADGEEIREKSPLVTYEIVRSSPLGWQHIIGGKSPQALNDAINATLGYAIDVAQIVLGFTGVPSTLLDGFLNDAFFAFQLVQHYQRRSEVGPYHPAIEVFTPTQTGTYNIEALFQFIQVLWDSRGYTTAVATFRGQNGPLRLGRDIMPGQLMSLVHSSRTKIFTDHIELVSFKSNRTTREVTVHIGDGKPIQHPIVEIKRNFSELIAAFNVATLAPS